MNRPVRSLTVVSVGWSTTIQDGGRPGLAHLGVPAAGAVDRATYALVNRLVGNDPSAAVFETLGALVIEASSALVVARSSDGSRHTLAPGDRLRVDAAPGRLWGYLAVRGGVATAPVLGSRSRDTLSGIGGPLVAAGDVIAVGDEPVSDLAADHAPQRAGDGPIGIWPGPHTDWFVGGVASLTTPTWTVSSDVSRVGCRLEPGAFVRRTGTDSMPSSGLVPGAVQVTPEGGPIIMLANHPTTGGYPVIAVVDPDDLGRVAQSRPGSTLTLRAVR